MRCWEMVCRFRFQRQRFIRDDSDEGARVPGQEEFDDLAGPVPYDDVAGIAETFPLPDVWEPGSEGLWWRDVKEGDGTTYDRERTAGRLKHRLKLNRPAPPLGYEYPFQVLKLHWTRGEAQGSPWVNDGGNDSVIKKFIFGPDEDESNEVDYDPILTLAENKATTLHAVRFEEVEPESGFDDHVRYLTGDRFELPWLAVANSEDPGDPPNAQVKLHFSPAEPELALDVEVEGGHSATVTPDTVSGDEPVTLTIEGSNDFGESDYAYEGTLRIEEVDVLRLVFYARREVDLAVHEISLINDDVEKEYHTYLSTDPVVIAPGDGRPDRTCITRGDNGILESTPAGDDNLINGEIRTGLNGVCETEAAGDDVPVIPLGQGDPDAVIITEGPNGELNTPVNEPTANIPTENGGIHNPQDDKIVDATITTGADGIRQTPAIRPRTDPVNVPSEGQLQDFLDRTYGVQANIWFDIVGWDAADAAFDVASTRATDEDYPELEGPNYHFDYFAAEEDSEGNPALTREESIVHAASRNSGEDVLNLYFIAAKIQSNFKLDGTALTRAPLGFARSLIRSPYISAYNPILGDPALHPSSASLTHVAAHELGHNDVHDDNEDPGLHHPWKKVADDDDPPANEENGFVPYLPSDHHTLADQQRDRHRLMWPTVPEAPNPATGRMPGLLLKDEADVLNEFNQPEP